jgi:hypothetical protein
LSLANRKKFQSRFAECESRNALQKIIKKCAKKNFKPVLGSGIKIAKV